MHKHRQPLHPKRQRFKSLISTFGRVATNEISFCTSLGKQLCPSNVQVVGPGADLGIPLGMLISVLSGTVLPCCMQQLLGVNSLVLLQSGANTRHGVTIFDVSHYEYTAWNEEFQFVKGLPR